MTQTSSEKLRTKQNRKPYLEKEDTSIVEHTFNTHPLASNKSQYKALLCIYLTYTLEAVAVMNAAVKRTSHIYLHCITGGTMQKQQLNNAHMPVLGSIMKWRVVLIPRSIH